MQFKSFCWLTIMGYESLYCTMLQKYGMYLRNLGGHFYFYLYVS